MNGDLSIINAAGALICASSATSEEIIADIQRLEQERVRARNRRARYRRTYGECPLAQGETEYIQSNKRLQSDLMKIIRDRAEEKS